MRFIFVLGWLFRSRLTFTLKRVSFPIFALLPLSWLFDGVLTLFSLLLYYALFSSTYRSLNTNRKVQSRRPLWCLYRCPRSSWIERWWQECLCWKGWVSLYSGFSEMGFSRMKRRLARRLYWESSGWMTWYSSMKSWTRSGDTWFLVPITSFRFPLQNAYSLFSSLSPIHSNPRCLQSRCQRQRYHRTRSYRIQTSSHSTKRNRWFDDQTRWNP